MKPQFPDSWETPKWDSHWEDWVRSGRRSGLKLSELLRGPTVLRRTYPEGGTGHLVTSDSVEPGIQVVRLKSVQKRESKTRAVRIFVKGTPLKGRGWRHCYSGCLVNV